jgi:hypothetical protein
MVAVAEGELKPSPELDRPDYQQRAEGLRGEPSGRD